MNIIYSFNKTGYEAECWTKEIKEASDSDFTFIPFNHGSYLDPILYIDSLKLDKLYQTRNNLLFKMYSAFEDMIKNSKADAVIVNNCPPYHPDYLAKINIYKVLYSGDDPGSTYKRNIPYLHAYNHVFYLDPAYSPDMDMNDKMRYCGMANADLLPHSVFDYEFDTNQTPETILSSDRDIDVIYIGNFFKQKLDVLAKVKKAFGNNFRIFGFFRPTHNLYFNTIYGYTQWVRPVSFQERIKIYQRSKIGINIHWNDYGLGNQRLYQLPANGVMQISDCPKHLNLLYNVGTEVETYYNTDDLIDKIKYYLAYNDKRNIIALEGFQRTMRNYRFKFIMRQAGQFIVRGMKNISWLNL